MWRYVHTCEMELLHYGVKGMKWGVRRNNTPLDKDPKPVKMNLQLFAKKVKQRKTIHLPIQEYAMVMHEIRTNITPAEKLQKIIRRPIGDHYYRFENNFNDSYRVIGKRRIPHTATGLLERLNDDD